MTKWTKFLSHRRWRVGLSLGLLTAGLVWLLLPASLRDEARRRDEVGDEVLQGLVPGLGRMTLTLRAGGSIWGNAFCQQDGTRYSLTGNDDQGRVQVDLVAADHLTTNGSLTLNWVRPPAAFIGGSWQAAKGGPAVPVKFQRVAQMWRRHRFRPLSIATAGVRVTEWTSYPVFPGGWQMDQISRELRRGWWRSERDPATSFYWGAVNLVRDLFESEAFEPVDLGRTTEVLFVSDKLVSIFTRADTAVMLDSATRREMWNYVIEKGHARRFGLAELFRPGTPWEERLSALCLEQLGPLPEQANGQSLSAKQMAEFAVLPAGLLIQSDPYGFGVGADNDYHVVIPWARLRDLLDPNGPARVIRSESCVTPGA